MCTAAIRRSTPRAGCWCRRSCGGSWSSNRSRCGSIVYNGRINVVGKKIHEERMQRALVESGREGEDARKEGIEVAAMYARSGHAARVPGVSGVRPDGMYLDATAGLGGHTGAIARQLLTRRRVWFWRATGMRRVSSSRAREHRGLRGSRIRFHQVSFSQVGEALAAEGHCTTGRAAGGFRRLEVSVDGRREGVLADGGRPAGHAHGSQPGADRGRHRQLRIGKGTRRLDLSIGRGKEEPEDSQSNRAGAADTNHRSVGQADRGGRAPYGKTSSGDANVHGAADRGESTRCEELDALLGADSASW